MEARYTSTERKRNYGLLVAEGILFTVGLVFFDPNTVLPLLMERMTGSAILVGLIGAIQPLAKGVAPILSGNWISSLTHKKRFLVIAMSIGRLPLWILGIALIWIPETPAFFWAALIVAVQLLFWFGDSAGDPAWMDMVGKAVPATRRGRFFATRQVVGGLLSVAAGAAVAAILDFDGFAFPVNYGVVITIGAAIYLGNVGTFVGLVEHPGTTSERHDIITLIRKLPAYLAANRTFARTMGVLVLFNMARLSLPFYVVFGQQAFGLAERALGLFIPLQMAGRILGTLTLGLIGDRHGHQRSIKAISIVCIAPPLVALLTGAFANETTALAAFALLFFLLGAYLEGWPSFMNYMLETVSERDRPMYAGLMGVGFVPSIIAPIAGGLLIQNIGYPALFVVTAVVAISGAALAIKLPRPSRLVSQSHIRKQQ